MSEHGVNSSMRPFQGQGSGATPDVRSKFCGCSSVAEQFVANEQVARAIRVARSKCDDEARWRSV